MPEEAMEFRDRQQDLLCRFDKHLREELKALATDAVVEEYRRNPFGRHSDALHRLMNYFRRASGVGKYAIHCVKPFAEYRMIALAGRRGVAPRVVDDRVFASPEEAMQAVFLKRVKDLRES